MKPLKQILFYGFIFLFTSCVTLYKPNVIHSPLLKEKGKFNSSASLGLSGCGLFNLQAAYAVSNHTGVLIDGMYHLKNQKSDDSSVEKLKMFFGEVGAGYFTTFGDKKNGLFQCYGGGGYGSTTDRIDNSMQNYPQVNAKYFNVFIQPGVALIDENFELAFDMRANYVNLFNINAYLYDQFEWWNTDFTFGSDTTLNFLNIEPTVTMKAGTKKLKGTLQLGLTIPTVNPNSYFAVNTASFFGFPLIKISFGANYAF
ncbi:MAG: hypothetical protein IPO63_07360 [Bacteroidetes bacterium]|nr:hypothetical protein [Bacteroidota bacterium]